MRTLVIHPKDRSTNFLKGIYENIPNKVVITNGVSRKELKEIIPQFDRVIMCGHGSPYGLMGVGQFKDRGNIIDETLVYLLQNMEQNIYIWCHANMFVERFKLKGFYSGMFVSEVSEGHYCGVQGVNKKMVESSNYRFVKHLSSVVEKDKLTIFKQVKKKYGITSRTNPVSFYNHQRLFVS